MAIRRNANGKIIAKRFGLEEIEDAMEHYLGFCLACGAQRECCEPDARKYECEACELKHVYAAQEILFMGLVREDV